MSEEDKLRLDYEQTTKYFHALADARFKLLAFVPTVTGVSIGALAHTDQPRVIIPLSIFGLLVTFGVMCYDLRNSQIYNALQLRARGLEIRLEFDPISNLEVTDRQDWHYGGAFLDRPARKLRFFGLLIWHDRGLAFVYSTALAAWAYLFTHALIQVGQLVVVEIAVPFLVFAAVFGQLFSLDKATDELGHLPKPYRSHLTGEQRVDTKR
jgi:hypothetical protein